LESTIEPVTVASFPLSAGAADRLVDQADSPAWQVVLWGTRRSLE
jgi:hypothetical protein